MTQEQRIKALAEHIATLMKNLKVKQGDLLTLATTEKTNLVGALNELKGLIDSVDLTALIDDAANDTITDKTYSANKIHSYWCL